ncbi:hypothetical protein QBC32DRAFT_360639 [Pseudoneurospora amorphoporcata]|uniref:Uncharacterized protein n=1 Tax=Pseudoneurospora amorphoporcata TaxID=241081 RepID=A0AAN6NXE8_9PEZI|nr:hypothetical protein QBC32DRAFT_360639 [Pseudoneurospora amorphoporcata]
MNRLPQEVVNKIAGFLFPFLAGKMDNEYDGHFRSQDLMDLHSSLPWEGDHFSEDSEEPYNIYFGAASCAAISRVWKRSIEQLTFWMLKIRSRSDAMIAEEAMSGDLNEHRRKSVRRIAWTINLDVRRTSSFPHIRDRVMVAQFRDMFEFINRLRPSFEAANGELLLSINILGMGAWGPENAGDESAFTAPPPDFQDLPICPAVTGLDIYYDVLNVFGASEPIVGNKVPPVWIVETLSKLTSVTNVDWEFYDFLYRCPEKRGRFHKELCRTLTSPLFASLQVLRLYIGSYDYNGGPGSSIRRSPGLEEHLARNPYPKHGEDGLNSALRTLLQNLVNLSIRGTFTLSPDFFHKKNGEAHKQPSWPRLERLSIMTTNIACIGNLYLPEANQKDPFRSGQDYETVWINDVLSRPTTNDFNELMLSLSRGMLSMPKLERLEIRVLCHPHGDYLYRNPPEGGIWQPTPHREIKMHGLIDYNREASQAVPLAECHCQSASNSTAAELSCNLSIFDEDHIARWAFLTCTVFWLEEFDGGLGMALSNKQS